MESGRRHGADLSSRLRTRGDLMAFLTALAHGIGADSYMLLAMPRSRESGLRILASNWIFDAVEMAGQGLLSRLAGSAWAAAPGAAAQPITAAHAPDVGDLMSGEEAAVLDVLGHGEIWVLRVQAGPWRFFVMFSSAMPGAIDPESVTRAQLECGYALAQVPGLLAAAASENPLSERERECLFWVSEGKTTEEVSLILSVAANTVNSYITHAMQKLAATNRPMAVACAIRAGII